MHVTDLTFNHRIGLHLAAPGQEHLPELPESGAVLNHVGTVHASAQFALAEACSGEFLLRYLGDSQDQVFAILRSAEVKFRKPAHGTLCAAARFAAEQNLLRELTSRRRALASIHVEVSDANHVVTTSGHYDWFLQRQAVPD